MSVIARRRPVLREEMIARLRAHLVRRPPHGTERVIVLGSLARGDLDGASEADVPIIGAGLLDSAIHDAAWREMEMLPLTPEQWRRALERHSPFALDIERDGAELWRAP